MTKPKTRNEVIIEDYAHDYRGMRFTEDGLADVLKSFTEALNCDHRCSSNCRREGCNCACGEYHL